MRMAFERSECVFARERREEARPQAESGCHLVQGFVIARHKLYLSRCYVRSRCVHLFQSWIPSYQKRDSGRASPRTPDGSRPSIGCRELVLVRRSVRGSLCGDAPLPSQHSSPYLQPIVSNYTN